MTGPETVDGGRLVPPELEAMRALLLLIFDGVQPDALRGETAAELVNVVCEWVKDRTGDERAGDGLG